MTTETERKFLVPLSSDALRAKYPHQYGYTEWIKQCYLPDTGEWAARIRHVHVGGRDYPSMYITLKRKITDETCVELEASFDQYDKWKAVCGPELKKRRDIFFVDGIRWYVDEFTQPEFNGLVMAEVEFTIGDTIELPEWVGTEVTSDPEYRNFRMVQKLI